MVLKTFIASVFWWHKCIIQQSIVLVKRNITYAMLEILMNTVLRNFGMANFKTPYCNFSILEQKTHYSILEAS